MKYRKPLKDQNQSISNNLNKSKSFTLEENKSQTNYYKLTQEQVQTIEDNQITKQQAIENAWRDNTDAKKITDIQKPKTLKVGFLTNHSELPLIAYNALYQIQKDGGLYTLFNQKNNTNQKLDPVATAQAILAELKDLKQQAGYGLWKTQDTAPVFALKTKKALIGIAAGEKVDLEKLKKIDDFTKTGQGFLSTALAHTILDYNKVFNETVSENAKNASDSRENKDLQLEETSIKGIYKLTDQDIKDLTAISEQDFQTMIQEKQQTLQSKGKNIDVPNKNGDASVKNEQTKFTLDQASKALLEGGENYSQEEWKVLKEAIKDNTDLKQLAQQCEQYTNSDKKKQEEIFQEIQKTRNEIKTKEKSKEQQIQTKSIMIPPTQQNVNQSQIQDTGVNKILERLEKIELNVSELIQSQNLNQSQQQLQQQTQQNQSKEKNTEKKLTEKLEKLEKQNVKKAILKEFASDKEDEYEKHLEKKNQKQQNNSEGSSKQENKTNKFQELVKQTINLSEEKKTEIEEKLKQIGYTLNLETGKNQQQSNNTLEKKYIINKGQPSSQIH